MKEARYYKKLPNKKVQCELCPHLCIMTPGSTGKCRARKNIDGVLYTSNYAKTITISIDPMEKKPLYHFYPGESVISIGPNSCNFSCDFCQNYNSSQQVVPTQDITPGKLLEISKQHQCDFVSYTYTEPITWFEFVLDSAKLLQENRIKNVMVTNGFINPEPLNELLPYIDAMNIDLKSMDDEFYKKICKSRLQPVLETIRTASKNCHIEITNLLVTDENDSEGNIRKLVDFVAEVNPDIPLHFSRYFPAYKMTNPPTPISRLKRAREIAEEKLSYVYIGNVMTEKDTLCPNCKHLLIKRGWTIKCDILSGNCPGCGHKIYGEFR
ncbi:MAG: AmmeMemoRadiSam system radical SAM enzyme [Candidatus Cloacimonetes bacterium]|nr:AmmeMemoRadiSam system radical SAM enzyme [Candidatus Cloacimonadota bacterium]